MRKIFILLACIIAVASGCKKATDLLAPRLFRPVSAAALAADSNTIVASWQKIGGAVAYKVQISRDTFRTVDVTVITDSSVAVVKKLLFNQLYQVQVKAIASDTTRNSSWATLGAISTLSSILKVPGLDDLTFNSVRVKWASKGAPVTAIKILKTADSSVVSQVTLTSADLAAEFKIISGLQASTKYTIFLYSGADVRGYVDFTSKAPFAGTIIDLTGITGLPSILADTLPKVPGGSTILLKRGETYNIATGISLDKNIIIMSAPDLQNTQQAKVFFTNNLSFANGAAIDSIEFNDLYMYSDNYGSRYIFNNTSSAVVGKLKFVNSRMEIFRGMVRLQSGTTTINSFIINNSIVDSIGNYSVLNIAATCKVDNISVINSTVYKIEGMVTSAANSSSVVVDNCTFSEAPLGNSKSYYVDYNTSTVSNGISVTNCLFGIGKNSAGAITVRDVRAASGTVISASNNYRTSDHLSAGNDLPNVITYTRPATQLWQDPFLGNFKIADNAFPGRATTGDPRWR